MADHVEIHLTGEVDREQLGEVERLLAGLGELGLRATWVAPAEAGGIDIESYRVLPAELEAFAAEHRGDVKLSGSVIATRIYAQLKANLRGTPDAFDKDPNTLEGLRLGYLMRRVAAMDKQVAAGKVKREDALVGAFGRNIGLGLATILWDFTRAKVAEFEAQRGSTGGIASGS